MSNTARRPERAPGAKPLAGPVSLAQYNQASRDVSKLAELLERAARECHLVSPATSIGSVPEGFEVATSAILVDIVHETYKVGGGFDDDEESDKKSGKLGLTKGALDRIAMAAGVSWHVTRRVDDAHDANFCAWLVAGRYIGFDGRPVDVQATKVIDLREGGPLIEALWQRYEWKLERWKRGGQRGYQPREPHAEIARQRLDIASNAETKARLRAIRSLGIRTSYDAEELVKPFVVAKLAATGATSDPALKRDFARMQFAAFIGSRGALYGDGSVAPSEPVPPPVPAPTIPPDPICDYCGADEDVWTSEAPDGPVHHCGDPRCIELARADVARDPAAPSPQSSYPVSRPDPTAASSGARPPAAGASSPTPAAGAAGRSEDVEIPFGRHKGKRLGEASDRFLAWLRDDTARRVSNAGLAPFRDENMRLLRHIIAVQKARNPDMPVPEGCGADGDDIPY